MKFWWEETNNDAVIILRVSTQKQNLDSQERELIKYCKEKNLNIVKTFRIKESAKDSSKRKEYSSALEFVRNKSILHLVFLLQDREARNLRDVESNLDLVKEGKLVIHYALENHVLHKESTDGDFTMREIKATFDKGFSRTLSTRVKFVMKCKAESGWYPGNKPPMGYKNKKALDEQGNELKRGTIIVPTSNTLDLRLVQREFELRAEGFSINEIRKKVLEENLVPSKIRRKYSKSGIEGRLKQKFYRGTFIWDGIEYNGNHELIIPSHILKAVDNSFGKYRITRRSKNEMGVFARGWITCGHPDCGMNIIHVKKKKLIKATGEEKFYEFYRCSNSRKIHKTMKGRYIKESELWSQFEDAMDKIQISNSFAEKIADALEEANRNAKKAIEQDIASYTESLEKLELREDKLYENLQDRFIDQPTYKRQLRRIRDERLQYTQLLKESQCKISDTVMINAKRILELASSAKTLWNMGTVEEKVEAIQRVCWNPVLQHSRVRYDLRKPFGTLVEMKESKNWRPLAAK